MPTFSFCVNQSAKRACNSCLHERQDSRRDAPAWVAQLFPNEHDRPDRRFRATPRPVQPVVREVIA